VSVTYELDGPVAWVTIDRPEARNALSLAVREGLWAATHRFNADADARVLVLTGAGDQAFCAGGDLKEMAQTALEVPGPDFLPIFGRTVDVAKLTIAAVNGVAYAGGFLLAQMCDLVVAADHARFAVTEVKVGRGTPWAAPLPWLVPPRVAMELLVTGEKIDAARARGRPGEPGRAARRAAHHRAVARRAHRGERAVVGCGREAHGAALAPWSVGRGRGDLGAGVPQRGRARGPAGIPREAGTELARPMSRPTRTGG